MNKRLVKQAARIAAGEILSADSDATFSCNELMFACSDLTGTNKDYLESLCPPVQAYVEVFGKDTAYRPYRFLTPGHITDAAAEVNISERHLRAMMLLMFAEAYGDM